MPKLSSEKQQEYREQYKQQRRRINRYIRGKQKQGFVADEDLRIGYTPEYVTKADVDRLRNITPEKLLKQMYYVTSVDEETGEADIVGGIEGRNIHRRQAYRETRNRNDENYIPDDAEMLLESLYKLIEEYDPAVQGLKGKTAHRAAEENKYLFGILNNAIARDYNATLKRVAKNYKNLTDIVERAQGYRSIPGDANLFSEILSGETLSLEENMEITEEYNDIDMLSDEETEDYDTYE